MSGADRSHAATVRTAIIVLAAVAVFQGVAALFALGAVDRGFERGRLAGATLADLQRFDMQKERLRSLTARAVLDGSDDPDRRAALLDDMTALVEAIAANATLAAQRDAEGEGGETDRQKRQETVAVLRRLVAKLRAEGAPRLLATGVAPEDGLDRIALAFDRQDGVDLRALMDERMAVEQRVQQRQRALADAALGQARWILLGTGGAAILAAGLLATVVPGRLLMPLRVLEEGVRAFATDRLDHRIPAPREREFAHIAGQLNGMAAELTIRRAQERGFRAALETAIEVRTAALRDALADVEASETARRALLADIGHELRTPITVIRGEAQVALRDRSSDAAAYRDSLCKIAAAAAQTGRLIDDLFAMSSARAETLSMTMATVDLRDVVRASLRTMAPAVAPGSEALHVDLPAAPVLAIADADRVAQVVSILLDNGLRYGNPAHGLSVTARAVNGEAEVTVADRGPGLDPIEAPRVFERGWRGTEARRRRPDGHGLGLAIAAGIAERHGGRLTLENRPGGGALARLRLPAA